MLFDESLLLVHKGNFEYKKTRAPILRPRGCGICCLTFYDSLNRSFAVVGGDVEEVHTRSKRRNVDAVSFAVV